MTRCRENNARALPRMAPLIFLPLLLLSLLAAAPRLSAAEAPLPPPKPVLVRIVFEGTETAIGRTAREQLDSFSTEYMRKGGRFEIRAYAGPPHDTSSNMRRLSLRRAIAIRQELMGRGIVPERILVRAMGGVSDSGPQERVDITLPGG